MVQCRVNGSTEMFVLDSGAARTTVVRDEALQLELSGEVDEAGGVFGPAVIERGIVGELGLGPVSISGLSVSVMPANGIARNLLGIDVLGHFCWRLSLDAKTLTINPDAEHPRNKLQIGERGHAYVDVVWEQHRASACWDTGAGITVVDSGFVARHPHLFTALGSSQGTDAHGRTEHTPTFVMASPTIGGQRFEPHPIAAVDLSAINASVSRPIDLILGYTTLRQADWVMDFPSKRWSISAVSPT